MKKGDKIRCIKACGSLNKGAEGEIVSTAVYSIFHIEGIGEKLYEFRDGRESEYLEVISSIAGMDGIRSALNIQQGGTHYKSLPVQPVEYIHANKIGYFEGNVIKYVTRWKEKNGIQDLEKAKHYIELLIELEKKND